MTSQSEEARSEMGTFRPRLLEAETAGSRIDALCAFIEFWIGPRQPSYGESAEALSGRPLPMPLRRLYQFAGRWPHRDHEGPIEYVVPALSHQDNLMALHALEDRGDGRVAFLGENQGNWECLTLSEGEDPPVWCSGDQFDEDDDFRGERLVCDSLSRFLTTFVLQELTLGSRLCLCDEGLSDRFASEWDAAVPVWTDGPYVSGIVQDYHLWGDVLVGRLWGDPFFAANHDEDIEFLTANQGPIRRIDLMLGQSWWLEIRHDGSALIRFQGERSAQIRAGTFEFPVLVEVLSGTAPDESHGEQGAVVFFHREGQSGGVGGRRLHDEAFVRSLFQQAFGGTGWWDRPLKRLWDSEWPA